MTRTSTEIDGDVSVTEPQPAKSLIGRFGWGLGDQLLSSLTNFLLGLLVARAVGPRELGAFSLAYAIYALALGGIRALSGELIVVRHSAVSTEQWRHGVRGAAGTALCAGVVVGLACVLAGLILGGSLLIVFSVLGVFLPALLIQDVWRFALFARRRGGAAFLNDTVWAIVMIAFFLVLTRGGQSSAGWFTLAWAGAGGIAALVGVAQIRVVPSGPVTAMRWLRQNRDLAPRFVAEFAVASGTASLAMFGIGAVAGLAQLGQLRAGQIALGPLNVLFGGAGLVATAEGVRLLRESPARFVRGCMWLSGALATAALLWGAVVFMLPRAAGEFLMGENWAGAHAVIVPLSIGSAAFGCVFGAYAGLRSLAAAKRSLRARSIDAVTTMSFALAGAAVGGAVGAAWGFAFAGCLEVAIAWWQFVRALSEYSRPDEMHDGRRQRVDSSGSDIPIPGEEG